MDGITLRLGWGGALDLPEPPMKSMESTRQRLRSSARLIPTCASHHPSASSWPGAAHTRRSAEMPPKTATTGALGGPIRRQAMLQGVIRPPSSRARLSGRTWIPSRTTSSLCVASGAGTPPASSPREAAVRSPRVARLLWYATSLRVLGRRGVPCRIRNGVRKRRGPGRFRGRAGRFLARCFTWRQYASNHHGAIGCGATLPPPPGDRQPPGRRRVRLGEDLPGPQVRIQIPHSSACHAS